MFVEFRVRVPEAVLALLILRITLSMLCVFNGVAWNVSEKFTVPEVLSNTPAGKFVRLLHSDHVLLRLVADLQSISGNVVKALQLYQVSSKLVTALVLSTGKLVRLAQSYQVL